MLGVCSSSSVCPSHVERAGRITERGHDRIFAAASLVRFSVSPSRLVDDLALGDELLPIFGMVLESPCLEGGDGNIVGQARLILSAVALSVSVVISQSFLFGLEGESALCSSVYVSHPHYP